MNLNFWVIQAFNGISYGALLFLVGSGLSLIFGVMRIVNLSHGSYFLLGGYVALSVIWTTDSWLLAIPVAALAIALVGLVMERVFLRPLGFDPLRQVLLTVGFAFLFQQAALDIWTGNNFDINPPAALSKSVPIGGVYFPLYRIFMIVTAAAIGLVLWLAMEKTRLGAQVRATVDDAQMARGCGIDTSRISMLIFSLGAFLAALGGVISKLLPLHRSSAACWNRKANPTVSSTCRSGSNPSGRRKMRSISSPTTAMASAATGSASSHEPVLQITDSAT